MTAAIATIAVRMNRRPLEVMEWTEHEVALCLAAFSIQNEKANGRS
jgi:hypothetical protein